MTSGNFNQFPGPARVVAASVGGRFLLVQGVGVPDGQQRPEAGTGLSIQLFDADKLLPLGEHLRSGSYADVVAAFAPDGTRLAYGSSEERRLATIPMDEAHWRMVACRLAGRDLTIDEGSRYDVERGTCAPGQ